jgi:hypothetical protein
VRGGADRRVVRKKRVTRKKRVARSRAGRRRPDSGGGEDWARGKEGVRVAPAWAVGLPNGRTKQPGAKIDGDFGPG